MEYKSKPTISITISCLLLFLILFAHLISIRAQEVEDESEFDYKNGSGKGPGKWGELKKEWEACKNGGMQSPIDLSNQRVRIIPKLGVLKRNYKPSNATVKNRGHDISLQWDMGKAGSIQINGSEYFLQQCHWHSPSEHTINGRRYDMELHMVHESSDGGIAVLMGHLSPMRDQKRENKMGMMHPEDIKLLGKKYYRYMGSLTVPPCSEGVIWTLNKKLSTVSREQVKLVRDVVHDVSHS
ncbi:hypothetical protein FEM48_Zijuj12G0046300 [Ziziphus jujuba var. spinosa]|uniref:Carbonic anhydrase n=1 Tax=Ziziphus jujuba var. spinosa TaxID=714518 RepID=A0A978UB78_ZIZJJ|nr:hypothetical protein FEM48_Zijuj12G0046300 [Ziziphus jujuba var. spinosa]